MDYKTWDTGFLSVCTGDIIPWIQKQGLQIKNKDLDIELRFEAHSSCAHFEKTSNLCTQSWS